MRQLLVYIIFLTFFSACATAPNPGRPAETVHQQTSAAQKVLGSITGRDVSRNELKRVVNDIKTNAESRGAVEKILGSGSAPVIKYSPKTGKHYSGNVDVDPETGEKLEVLAE